MGREPDPADTSGEAATSDEGESADVDDVDAGPDADDVADRGDGVVKRLATDAVFERLSNETRLNILQALYEAGEPRSFSALHDAVAVRDSGQFNYHLDKLQDVFVTQEEDGYELTAAGTRVVGAILAGQYTKRIEASPVPVGDDCSHCGGSLVGVFEGELARITCRSCDRNVIRLDVPPGVFEEYPRPEWPFVAERWTRKEFETVEAGFCPFCYGPIEDRIEFDLERISDVFDIAVEHACTRCDRNLASNVEASVVSHPAVVTFHYEHGVDVAQTPIWELEWAVRSNAEVTSRDPVRIEVPVELEDDRLVLVLDEAATVVDERRE